MNYQRIYDEIVVDFRLSSPIGYIENMRKSRLGKPLSADHRKNLSISHMGNCPSEETRHKLAEVVKLSWVKRKQQYPETNGRSVFKN